MRSLVIFVERRIVNNKNCALFASLQPSKEHLLGHHPHVEPFDNRCILKPKLSKERTIMYKIFSSIFCTPLIKEMNNEQSHT